MINIYIYYNKKDDIDYTINFLNSFFDINIKLDKNIILNEFNRYQYIKGYKIYEKNSIDKILDFTYYKSVYCINKNTNLKKGYFSVYVKWFDNYVIMNEIYTNKKIKLFVPSDLLSFIVINDILSLEIIKKEKSVWCILNILDFYPNGLNINTYR